MANQRSILVSQSIEIACPEICFPASDVRYITWSAISCALTYSLMEVKENASSSTWLNDLFIFPYLVEIYKNKINLFGCAHGYGYSFSNKEYIEKFLRFEICNPKNKFYIWCGSARGRCRSAYLFVA